MGKKLKSQMISPVIMKIISSFFCSCIFISEPCNYAAGMTEIDVGKEHKSRVKAFILPKKE